jgi:hypothetical protein
MGTGGPFPGGKARPGRDADHSSTAKIKNEYELYLVSPQAPPWRVVGHLRYQPSIQRILIRRHLSDRTEEIKFCIFKAGERPDDGGNKNL